MMEFARLAAVNTNQECVMLLHEDLHWETQHHFVAAMEESNMWKLWFQPFLAVGRTVPVQVDTRRAFAE